MLRAALREPNLPAVEPAHRSTDVKLLVDHREDLVGERTRRISRLRWHLHDLDPDLESGIRPRGLDATRVLTSLARRMARQPQTTQVRICRDLVRDITALSRRIRELEAELKTLVAEQNPQLLEIPGCATLTAAKIIGETGNPHRFRSEACYAMHIGAAPIPVSSGRNDRHRLARGGNRQLNAAVHRIALTQMRIPGPGRDYYLRRRAQGDTAKEALRALKRRITSRVFNTLLRSTIQPTQSEDCPAAA